MKLFIINGESNEEKLEIHINAYLMLKDIKYKLDEIFSGNGYFTKYYFKLIHKNIILLDFNSIKSYKICENDEIWFGKIENYLRKDDVIVYVFIGGPTFGEEHLIVKMNDTISTIKSIIERIHSEIIIIWNADGKQMENDQIVTEIDTNGNYKLIIRCDDGRGNEIINTFDECCCLHYRTLVDGYLYIDDVRDDNKNESTRTILIIRLIKIKQIISSNDKIDDRLNQNLSDLPSAFLNSTNLFCLDMSTRIADICEDFFKFVIDEYDDDVQRIIYQYFKFAIRAAFWNYSIISQQHKNSKTNKSVSDIVIEGLNYFGRYLNDSNNDWRYWLRIFMSQYSLRSFSDTALNETIDRWRPINKFRIKIRMNGKDLDMFIGMNPETILKAKLAISLLQKVDMKHLYCIKPGGDHKLNDEDKFDDEFIIEIVMSIEDIVILRSLGQGAFGATSLCLNIISNKQFVMKKPIQNDVDLYRDINIYSKLNSSRNIMIYSGLFRDEENICIGMEYLSGGTLKSYLDKGKHLSEQEIVKFSHEILTQINELHKLGIIHRDIKSDNIVIDEHNHVKLIDFGLSKYTIGWTSKDLSDKLKAYKPGTIFYMAPELIKEKPYSEKIDIWSFGMVMVEMATGKIPFHWLTPFQVVLHIRACTKYEFKPIIPISNELNQFINSCLNTNPEERPSAEHLIQSKLFK